MQQSHPRSGPKPCKVGHISQTEFSHGRYRSPVGVPDLELAMQNKVICINLGGVNCYLLEGTAGFMLIDSGFFAKRKVLTERLQEVGCKAGNLRIVVLTHGDHDHAGNAAFLRKEYGAKIAMHSADVGMVENGDMGWNRKDKPDRMSLLLKAIGQMAGIFTRGSVFEKFKPDIELSDGLDLAEHGFDGKVVHIPGHSKGSIGVLTTDGDLFCGDLIYNMPGFDYVDDLQAYSESIARLKRLKIGKIYPGHGKPILTGLGSFH